MSTGNNNGAAERRPIELRLDRVVREKDAKYLREKYNVVCESMDEASFHDFPVYEVETALSVREASSYLRIAKAGTVMRVGGPVDETETTWNVFPRDLTKGIVHNAVEEGHGCYCAPELCCHVVADWALLIHSAGALGVNRVADVLMNTRSGGGYIVCNLYPGISGELCRGNVQWYRSGITNVVCERADGLKWEVDPCDWLGETVYIEHLDKYLGSIMMRSFGDTYVFGVFFVNEEVDMPMKVTEEWSIGFVPRSEFDVVYSLPGVKTVRSVGFDWYRFGFNSVRVLPHCLFVTGRNEECVPVSKAILWSTQIWFMNRPRNVAGTLAAITRHVRAEYESVMNIPEDVKYKSQLVTVALVMSETMELETSVLSELSDRMSRVWGHHASAVSLEPPSSYKAVDVLAATFWGAVTIGTAKPAMSYFGLTYSPPLSAGFATKSVVASMKIAAVAATTVHMPIILPIWAGLTAAGLATGLVRRYDLTGTAHRTLAGAEWAKTNPGEAPIPLPDGVYPVPKGTSFGPSKVLKPVGEVLADDAKVGPVPNQEKKESKPKLELMGIAFSDTMPTYFEGTPAEERQAIVNRLAQGSEPDAVTWKRLGEAFRSHPTYLRLREHVRETPILINSREAQRYASKFTKGMQRTLMDEYDTYRRGNLEMPREAYRTKGFIKTEKAVKQVLRNEEVSETVNEPATARAIIGMHPMMSVVYGTLIMQYDERKKEFLCPEYGEYEPICPKGVCAEKRAEWFSYWVNKFGGIDKVIHLTGDKVAYDGSFGEPSFTEGINSTYGDAVVVPAKVVNQVSKSHETTRGRTYGGVKYSIDWVMASGSSATSTLGTAVNEMGTCHGISEFDISELGVSYAIACEGDDDHAIVRREYFQKTFGTIAKAKELVTERWKRLGFKCVPVISPNLWEVDYLSKLWYPVGDTWLLGGKIGRVLSRAGYFLNVKDEQNLRGAANSAFMDNHHVPFLREYFGRVLELTKGQRMTGRATEYTVHTREFHDYDDNTFKFVESRYGLTKEHLVEFKDLLSKVTRLPVVISWSHYSRLVEIDSS